MSQNRLSFERPIYELEARLARLEQMKTAESRSEAQAMRRELASLKKRIYASLEPWETVEVARHPERPHTVDYLHHLFDEFVELHGDRFFGDDRAVMTGFAKLDSFRVMVVGHEKGKTVKERITCNYGCAHPEGYRKAIAKMKLAAKFGIPVICLIDTPGAYPGIAAEERGQAQVIATSMLEMSRLKTPVICVVIGEGGSGGALGIGVGNRVAMLQHSYYSVISPEGCAGILWKSHEHKDKAAVALKMTSKDLTKLGVVDDVIAEPPGGAHRDPQLMVGRLKSYLRGQLRQLTQLSGEELVDQRYQRFRQLGVFMERGLLARAPDVFEENRIHRIDNARQPAASEPRIVARDEVSVEDRSAAQPPAG